MHQSLGIASTALIVAALLSACGDDAAKPPDGASPHSGAGGTSGTAKPPPEGATEFVSADANGTNNGYGGRGGSLEADAAHGSGGATASADDAGGFGNDGSARSVERGDIYRVLDDQRILNLNGYRGLQVIDIRDLGAPRVEGRLALTGTPVEMYVAGDRALLLLNDWSGYYGSRDDIAVERRTGGLVASVDLSDRAHPRLLGQAVVPGSIRTSRLTQGNGQAALYVASNGYYDQTDQTNHAYVQSFDVSGNALQEKTQLDLGGDVVDIQATVDVLLVAGEDWDSTTFVSRSTVTVVDISRPDGTLRMGGTITTAGYVQNKFNMDAYDGVLRIVSGVNWNGAQENHLETFDLSDITQLTPLDDCTFGDSEQLKATLFMKERAFFVTFFQTDPFHSFSIDGQGKCEEHQEFVVSGWNDFLRPALGDTRIVGIGTNTDGQTRAVSVSLYDATDLDNAQPLLSRADVAATRYSDSLAQWDDRAFGVIEDAVSIAAADGTTETGLVLLPFQGFGDDGYVAQVQLLTFSDHTLTLRGVMDHGTAVRRSFSTDGTTTANLSEEQLSLFDTTNPDQPKELGRVDVAPNYSQVFVFGEYVARVKNRSLYYSYQSTPMSVEPPKTQVQLLPRTADLDTAVTKASFEVPANAELVQVGDLLLSVAISAVANDNAKLDANGNAQPEYDSAIDVYDLSSPAHPRARGSLQTDRLRPSYYGDYGRLDVAFAGDCFDCGRGYLGGGNAQSDHHVVGTAIAFARRDPQQKSLGTAHQCNTYSASPECTFSSDGQSVCPDEYVTGNVTCTTPHGGQEWCTGGFQRCSVKSGECAPTDMPEHTVSDCYDYEDIRYWHSLTIDTLDISNPDAPALAASTKFAVDEEAGALLANGTDLYFNFQKPYAIADDPRAHVKRYFRKVDLSDPQHAAIGEAINVPGEVIASDDDTIYTRDVVWDDNDTRTQIARLTVAAGRAYLQTSHLFEDRAVQAVRRDGAGHVLVSSDPAWNYYVSPSSEASERPQHTLSILDTTSLQTVGEVDVDDWATFKEAKAGRALYQVDNGLLVFDVTDAAHPTAQAYFATLGWPSQVLFDGSEILFAAGPYGVHRFDADIYNLLK